MPPGYPRESRTSLRIELTQCGLTADAAEHWVSQFSDRHLTSDDVSNIKLLVSDVRAVIEKQGRLLIEAQKQSLEKELQDERALRQRISDYIYEFIVASKKSMEHLTGRVDAVHKTVFGLSPQDLEELEKFMAEPPVPR